MFLFCFVLFCFVFFCFIFSVLLIFSLFKFPTTILLKLFVGLDDLGGEEALFAELGDLDDFEQETAAGGKDGDEDGNGVDNSTSPTKRKRSDEKSEKSEVMGHSSSTSTIACLVGS